MYSMLDDIDGISCIEPQGAFYVFPDVSALLGDRWASSLDLAADILEEGAVAVVPGESFGAPGFLRLSYATSDADIEEGVGRIASIIAG